MYIFQVVEEKSPPALTKWLAAGKKTVHDYAVCRYRTHSVLWLTERYHQHVQVKDTIKKRWHAIDNDVHVATHESSNYSPPLVYVIHVLSWPHSSRPAKFLVRSDLSCMNILKKSFVLLAQAVRWGLQFWKMSDFYCSPYQDLISSQHRQNYPS